MLIPVEKTKAKREFKDFKTLLYGAPKIGKSTFCSQLDGPLFLDTETGLNSLEVYRVGIDTWDDFLQFLDEFDAFRKAGKLEKAPFKTIIVDTIDNLFMMCSKYTCNKMNVVHESDLAYGKGWSSTRKEFLAGLARLEGFGYGVVYTSHAKDKDVKTRTGDYVRFEPSMTGQCADIMLPRFDFVLFAVSIGDNDNVKRVIYTKPTQYYVAGDRTKKLPECIDFSASEFMSEYTKAMEE